MMTEQYTNCWLIYDDELPEPISVEFYPDGALSSAGGDPAPYTCVKMPTPGELSTSVHVHHSGPPKSEEALVDAMRTVYVLSAMPGADYMQVLGKEWDG